MLAEVQISTSAATCSGNSKAVSMAIIRGSQEALTS
jgi:hypothetical protein